MKRIQILLFSFILVSNCFSCTKETKVSASEPLPLNRSIAMSSGEYTLTWKGIDWAIKHAPDPDAPKGPGENIWHKDNVWVDEQDRLHLKIVKQANGRYTCAEIRSLTDFQYGTYTWKVVSRLDSLHKDVIFGLFQYGGEDYINEIDFEFTKWNNPAANWCNYTVYRKNLTASNPEVNYVHTDYTEPLSGTFSTHVYTRTSSSITFKSYHGHGNTNLFTNLSGGSWVYDESGQVPTKAMPVYIQLWTKYKNLPAGLTYTLDSDTVEVIVSDFTFTP